jgi:hypothetical protein
MFEKKIGECRHESWISLTLESLSLFKNNAGSEGISVLPNLVLKLENESLP